MKKLLATAAAAAFALVGAAGAAQAASTVKVGVLTCDVEPGLGFVIGSDKALDCWFKPSKGGKSEHYSGSIKKLGIDVGYTAKTKIAWLVFAAQKAPNKKHALAGTYVGASHEVTLGLGLGGNWLIGGSNKSFALQPWSIQGQVGLNWSLTWTDLELH
ncbi:MAG TPA: DUF992 domain-containing protein [Devosia sp.]|jgi:hypothetical protein|nr:DUF992 domain-containing protein [Devosia sp.]